MATPLSSTIRRDGSANSIQGRRLNRPNDVVVKSDGAIYVTDPWTLETPQEQWDLTFAGVYRLTPDLGTFTLLVDNFVLPNGPAFSPDESVLYRLPARPHPRLRRDAERRSRQAERPRVRRSARQRARR